MKNFRTTLLIAALASMGVSQSLMADTYESDILLPKGYERVSMDECVIKEGWLFNKYNPDCVILWNGKGKKTSVRKINSSTSSELGGITAVTDKRDNSYKIMDSPIYEDIRGWERFFIGFRNSMNILHFGLSETKYDSDTVNEKLEDVSKLHDINTINEATSSEAGINKIVVETYSSDVAKENPKFDSKCYGWGWFCLRTVSIDSNELKIKDNDFLSERLNQEATSQTVDSWHTKSGNEFRKKTTTHIKTDSNELKTKEDGYLTVLERSIPEATSQTVSSDEETNSIVSITKIVRDKEGNETTTIIKYK